MFYYDCFLDLINPITVLMYASYQLLHNDTNFILSVGSHHDVGTEHERLQVSDSASKVTQSVRDSRRRSQVSFPSRQSPSDLGSITSYQFQLHTSYKYQFQLHLKHSNYKIPIINFISKYNEYCKCNEPQVWSSYTVPLSSSLEFPLKG